jgi:hypothetical protein
MRAKTNGTRAPSCRGKARRTNPKFGGKHPEPEALIRKLISQNPTPQATSPKPRASISTPTPQAKPQSPSPKP